MPRFVTVAKADSIQPGQMIKVEIDNFPVAVANVGGTFHAFDDTSFLITTTRGTWQTRNVVLATPSTLVA